MKIDFVIPWVDGNDRLWQKEKEKYDNSLLRDYTNSDMRYRDWGTLKYVMRSIEKNAPWYNKIYLITAGHYPEWLDLNSDKVELITHDELYFDKSHLPTFSSRSIEMNLPNLDKLAEKFIHMNDDTLITKKVDIDRFFIDNKPVDFLSHGWLPRNKLFKKLRGMNAWAHAIKNNIDLINNKFQPMDFNTDELYHYTYSRKTKISNWIMQNVYKEIIWLEHWHHPTPYLKRTLKDVSNEFPNEMMKCSKNRFRTNDGLNPYIYRYWQLATHNFYPFKHNDGLFCKIENKKDMNQCLRSMGGYTFVCPNDSVPDTISEEEYTYIETTIIEKLDKLFPNKASFEKVINNE